MHIQDHDPSLPAKFEVSMQSHLSGLAMVEFPEGGGSSSTISKLHQNHFQAILDKFEIFSKVGHLQWGGGLTQLCPKMKVAKKA